MLSNFCGSNRVQLLHIKNKTSKENLKLLQEVITQQGIDWVLKKLDGLGSIVKSPHIFTVDNNGQLLQWTLDGRLKQDWGEICRDGQVSATLTQDNKYLFILSKANPTFNEDKNLLRQLDVQDYSLVKNWH